MLKQRKDQVKMPNKKVIKQPVKSAHIKITVSDDYDHYLTNRAKILNCSKSALARQALYDNTDKFESNTYQQANINHDGKMAQINCQESLINLLKKQPQLKQNSQLAVLCDQLINQLNGQALTTLNTILQQLYLSD